ncbi:MAG: hypothetical protein CUN55_18930 [Phototrophicales bacterium]|nr:MAG: hypothetical protein CUN55_18930 [Phototrophicales bacterium]
MKELESRLGLASYYARFIKNDAMIIEPFLQVKRARQFNWAPPQQKAFEAIRKKLMNPIHQS